MPGSVGGFVSYGCIRMLNADITDLFQRVGRDDGSVTR
jgi:lipoprotein-anchoring transpeptidase ErfK/SrfK